MNRLAPVLYIRSTLANERSTRNPEEMKHGQDREWKRPELPMSAGISETESTPVLVGSEENSRPCAGRGENLSLFGLCDVDGPFGSVEPSGDTPPYVEDDPFESAFTEIISVGFVPVYMPRLTDPIAPCTGFAMQAEIVQHTSKFAEFRKAQRKALPERERKAEGSEGGLFFASRVRGQSPSLNDNDSNDASYSDFQTPQKPLFDYLGVDIPDVSIVVPRTEGSL